MAVIIININTGHRPSSTPRTMTRPSTSISVLPLVRVLLAMLLAVIIIFIAIIIVFVIIHSTTEHNDNCIHRQRGKSCF